MYAHWANCLTTVGENLLFGSSRLMISPSQSLLALTMETMRGAAVKLDYSIRIAVQEQLHYQPVSDHGEILSSYHTTKLSWGYLKVRDGV